MSIPTETAFAMTGEKATNGTNETRKTTLVPTIGGAPT
jgi:hypothetical protein